MSIIFFKQTENIILFPSPLAFLQLPIKVNTTAVITFENQFPCLWEILAQFYSVSRYTSMKLQLFVVFNSHAFFFQAVSTHLTEDALNILLSLARFVLIMVLWWKSRLSQLHVSHFKTWTSSLYEKKNAVYCFQISLFIPEIFKFLNLAN